MFSLESPHRGDSNENTKYTIFNVKQENYLKLSQICSYGSFSAGLKNEFETTVVNKPSVFEPLKFYCSNLGLSEPKKKSNFLIFLYLYAFKISCSIELTMKKSFITLGQASLPICVAW